jgi:hypothetical protein
MEAVRVSKTSVDVCRTTWRYIPQDTTLPVCLKPIFKNTFPAAVGVLIINIQHTPKRINIEVMFRASLTRWRCAEIALLID